MRKLTKFLVTATATAGLVVSGGIAANAMETSNDPLHAVASATPDTVNNSAAVRPMETGQNALEATVSGADVVVPVDPTVGMSIGTNAGDIAVSLPFASKAENATAEQDGIVSFENNNGSTSVPVITKEGSLQINTVIASAAAPARYSYDLSIPEGGEIVPAGGGYFIANANHDPVAFISAPWAKDAKGASIPTHYELNGTTLTQVVGFTSATAFPVVADPQFAWYGILPSVQLNRSETKTATTLTGMATVCGWVTRFTTYAGGVLCGANAASIIVNAQRIYFNEKRCAQLLIGPGVVGTVGYSGGYCK